VSDWHAIPAAGFSPAIVAQRVCSFAPACTEEFDALAGEKLNIWVSEYPCPLALLLVCVTLFDWVPQFDKGTGGCVVRKWLFRNEDFAVALFVSPEHIDEGGEESMPHSTVLLNSTTYPPAAWAPLPVKVSSTFPFDVFTITLLKM
jgi:hypothetical protein